MDDSEEQKWISLIKDNNSDANQSPRLQISEHLLFEAVLVPQLYEEPNSKQITPLEPNGIILNSDIQSNKRI